MRPSTRKQIYHYERENQMKSEDNTDLLRKKSKYCFEKKNTCWFIWQLFRMLRCYFLQFFHPSLLLFRTLVISNTQSKHTYYIVTACFESNKKCFIRVIFDVTLLFWFFVFDLCFSLKDIVELKFWSSLHHKQKHQCEGSWINIFCFSVIKFTILYRMRKR